jgi:hypothetical protein
VRRVVLVLALVAGLAAAGAAEAKNISGVKLCGPSACGAISDPALLRRAEGGGAPTIGGTPPLAPFYRYDITITGANGETFENGKRSITVHQWYVPQAHAMRGVGDSGAAWYRVDDATAAVFRKVTRGVEPFPTPTIVAATIGGRAADAPATYSRLFDPSWRLAGGWPDASWRRIELRAHGRTPWTDGQNVYAYSARDRLLARDGAIVEVPAPAAARLSDARSLSRSRGGASTAAVAAGAAAIAAVAAAAAFRRRRRGP